MGDGAATDTRSPPGGGRASAWEGAASTPGEGAGGTLATGAWGEGGKTKTATRTTAARAGGRAISSTRRHPGTNQIRENMAARLGSTAANENGAC